MSEPGSEPPLEHGPKRGRRLSKPVFYGFAVVCFAVFASLLLTRNEPRRAQLTIADLGRPSKFDVRAQQATYVPDDVTTKRLRDESSRKAPLVYAHAPGARDRQVDLLRSAFTIGREPFDRYESEVKAALAAAQTAPPASNSPAHAAPPSATPSGAGAAAPAAASAEGSPPSTRELDIVDFDRRAKTRPPPIASDGPTTALGRKLPPRVHRPIAARLAAALQKAGVEVARLVPLTPQELVVLSQLRYSRKAEEAAVRLLSVALDAVVVRDRVKLLVDQSSGIVLRGAGDQLTRIEKVLSPSEILDIAGARARITEAAADFLSDTTRSARDTLASAARRLVVENLVFDTEATGRERTRARGHVQRQFRHYPRGSVILRQGDLVKPEHLAILDAIAPSSADDGQLRSYVGSGLFALLLGGLCFLATRTRAVRRKPSGRDYMFLGVWMLLSLFTVRVALEVAEALHDRWQDVPLSAFVLLIPFSLGALLVRLVLSSELAVLFAMVLSVLVAVMTGGGSFLAVYAFVGSFGAAIASGHVRQRSHLLRTGLWIGVGQLAAVVCIALLGGQGGFPLSEAVPTATPEQGLFRPSFLLELAGAISSGLFAGLLSIAFVPVIELSFDYTTTMKYQELGSLENPLLKELFLRAPGTYHHSVVAGSLAEAAADAIGANGALARVGAYYHDVGKGKCPDFFAENQRGDNPHDRIAPHTSAQILKRHVEDGVAILREHKLPKPIIDICAQHLGTTLTEFFYVKARRIADEKNTTAPTESDFRYAGPKPQFREAALVFIADSVEAAGRSIREPTREKIDEMVRRIIRNKFVDGQLDECDLTLRDLDAIAKAMTRVLVAIHHTRPQYPQQTQQDTLPRASTESTRARIPTTQRERGAEGALPSVAAVDSREEHGHSESSEAPIDLSDHRRRLR